MQEPITVSEFARIEYRPLRGLWIIETPYTSDQTRFGYSDAYSSNRSSKVKARTRTFLSKEAAEKFAAATYAKRKKAGTLPVKTACTFKGQAAWLMPEVDGRRECYSSGGQWLSYLLTVGLDADDQNFVIN